MKPGLNLPHLAVARETVDKEKQAVLFQITFPKADVRLVSPQISCHVGLLNIFAMYMMRVKAFDHLAWPQGETLEHHWMIPENIHTLPRAAWAF